MFDIGFWELILISAIGLIVLGPERLPIAIRSVVRWLNTVKGVANTVKSELTKELDLNEINKASKEFTDIGNEVKGTIKQVEQSVQVSTDEASTSAEQNKQDGSHER